MLKEGDKVPDNIELLNQDGDLIKLKDYKGKKLVVYFYPKDNTPGCTTEAINFRDSIKEYENKDIAIIGISADTVKSHKNFQTKYDLPFTLLSDPEKKAAKAFGAVVQGRVKRRTWLVNEDWVIEKTYETVSPSKHNNELCTYYGITLKT
ncbi:MAG: Peroxiredoxin Bcp [Promethearchaeota archaeon]|nr:MAG: Peroxiredoxin Bcp [Candidatus Lokiarchaeota archaeon]